MAENDGGLVLEFDHNVIEHLGLKLYQNRPTNVIAEMVSNSWDADGRRVWIDLVTEAAPGAAGQIAISDDGSGMSLETIREKYLVIGLPKRPKNQPDVLSPGGRRPMGRKGIGKLAPFGIATKIDVVTIAHDAESGTARMNWFRLDFGAIRAAQDQRRNNYPPDVVLLNADATDTAIAAHDSEGTVKTFLSRVRYDQDGQERESPTGTLMPLRGLTLKRALSQQSVLEAMGRRFTVTLLRSDFSVFVNGAPVTEAVALPKFGQRIPATGFSTDHVNGREVRYWVGFVETAAWPADQAGIGVYAHGKIAQDRPFTFGQKGREIYARYMYGVVEADWLDELQEDVVSTDRTSVDWEHDDTIPLYEWGQNKVRGWLAEQLKWRAESDSARSP